MTSERDRYDRMYVAFEEARQRPPTDREAILERRCGADTELRHEVEALLRAHDTERDDAFSEHAVDVARRALRGLEQQHPSGLAAWGAGARVGPYQLVRKVRSSEGCVAWLAESAPPQPRRVTVEIGAADHARRAPGFERAAAVLRELEHPNLTRVLDSGTTANGCPYLVTELSLGTPLLRHAAEAELELPERTALFLAVCAGVRALEEAGLTHPGLDAREVSVDNPASQPTPKLTGLVFAREHGSAEPGTSAGAPEQAAPARLAALLEELLADLPRRALAPSLFESLARAPESAAPGTDLSEWIRGVQAELESAAERRGVLGRLRGLFS